MARRPLTDAQLAALPPERRAATLKKRRQRAAQGEAAKPGVVLKFAATAPTTRSAPPPPSEHVHGLAENEQRAKGMYETLRGKMQRAGTWNDEACHGPLVLYCKSVVTVEQNDVQGIPASVLTAVSKLHAQLGLANLPADRIAKHSKFTGTW